MRFKSKDIPSENQLIDWFEYICSLPSISNLYETISSFDEFPSNSSSIIKKYHIEVHINHDEVASTTYDKLLSLVHNPYNVNDNQANEPLSQNLQEFDKQLQEEITNKLEGPSATKYGNHYELISKNKIINQRVQAKIKMSNNMRLAVQISEFDHFYQIQNSRQLENILQEITITQENDLEFEICNEENGQEFTNRDISKFIAFDSHFHLYPDISTDRNLSPLYFNVVLENREVDINKLPISFHQDRESFIDHSYGINEHVVHIPSCFDTSDESGENFNECSEVIYDNYSECEDVHLSSYTLNPHD